LPVIRQYEEGISSNRCLVRNGEEWIRDELTVCRWGGIRIGGNRRDKYLKTKYTLKIDILWVY